MAAKKKEEEYEIVVGSRTPDGLTIVPCCSCCKHSRTFEHGDDENLDPIVACLNGVPAHEIPSRMDHADYYWSHKYEVVPCGWCSSFEMEDPKPVLSRNEPWEDDEDGDEEETDS
jgi:hypothetical protein